MLLHCVWNFVVFIIALGVLITVHECGHFLIARFFKVQVEKFSIGFGPALWKWYDSNNTEYVISIILLGGYVKLFNAQTVNTRSYYISQEAFNYKKDVWKRIVIVLAGPVFNFIFSILLYTVVYIIGIPICKPIIHDVIPNSIVTSVGISSGVEIKSINNVQTPDWKTVRLQIFNNIKKEKIIISTMSINGMHSNIYTIYLSKCWRDLFVKVKDPILALGIVSCNTRIIPVLSDVKSNSPAKQGGLKIGDKILAINDHPILNWNFFITNIKNNSEKIFKISVERQHKVLHCYVIPDKNHLVDFSTIESMISVVPKIITVPIKTHCMIHKYSLHNAIFKACIKTWELMYLIINALIKLILGDIKTIDIGGPIAIAQGAGDAARFGLIYYLMFLAVISINLGIINLLPFPTLDGGHLFFLILEIINGKPVSSKIQNFGYIIGLTLLVLIMCFVILNDFSKLW